MILQATQYIIIQGIAEASPGPYADNLHLTPDRYSDNHTNTPSLRQDALFDAQPTASKH